MESFEYRVHDAVENISTQLLNVVYMLDIQDKCETCKQFNKSEDVDRQANDCQEYGSCIATTLHPNIQEKLWNLL